MADIVIHIGPRKCGKSEYVEKELSIFNSKLYIATLPNINEFKETIIAHQKRRGDGWRTIEITKRFDLDILVIDFHINNTRPSACMLDGIISWYNYLQNDCKIKLSTIDFSEKLIDLIKSHENIVWRLVDVDPLLLKGIDKNWNDYKEIYDHLLKELTIRIIDWSYE